MIKPLGNRLLVTIVKEDASFRTAAGLYATDQEFKAPQSITADVVAIGPDVTGIKVGDRVYCSQFAPTQVKEKPGDNTVILPAEDVLGVLAPDSPAK